MSGAAGWAWALACSCAAGSIAIDAIRDPAITTGFRISEISPSGNTVAPEKTLQTCELRSGVLDDDFLVATQLIDVKRDQIGT